jgi:probable HAF family extracellular repeat protein
MKRSPFLRTVAAAAALVASSAGSALAAQAPIISAVPIALSPEASVTGINDQAIIVGNGRVNGQDSPFVTGPGGQGSNAVDGVVIGDVAAINDAGVIVGNIGTLDDDQFGFDMRAFMRAPGATAVVDLGTLGGTRSQATGINRSGQIVGWSTVAGSNVEHAFITEAGGTGMRDIGHLAGVCASANAINNHGQVAGYACTAGDRFVHAFVTDAEGANLHDLGTFGGHNSAALDVNAHGVVVGWAETRSGINHAFRTDRNGAGLVDLDPGRHRSQAFAINVRGHIVGQFLDESATARAFIASTNRPKFVDLNKLVKLPDGSVLMGAVAINNRDEVVAYASNGITYLLSRVGEAMDAWCEAQDAKSAF